MTKREKIKTLLKITQRTAENDDIQRSLFDSFPTDGTFEMENMKTKWQEAYKKTTDEAHEKLVDLYVKMMSEETIDAALKFYSSPAGKEVLELGPEIDKALHDIAKGTWADLTRQMVQDILELGLDAGELERMGIVRMSPDEFTQKFGVPPPAYAGDFPEDPPPPAKDKKKKFTDEITAEDLDSFFDEYIDKK